MKKKQIGRKALCALLAASLASVHVFAAGAPAPAAAEGTSQTQAVPAAAKEEKAAYKKSETVYVNLEPDGTPREQIVSNWLHSEEAGATLVDRSTLKEVENVKGEEQPARSGSDLTWKLEGNDLYYRGKTEGELPVSVEITYTLDGIKMSPEEIAGKSGHMEMSLHFRNNLRQTVSVGGKRITMYTPMMAAAAISFPNAGFSNVAVSDGTVQADGSNQAVALAAMPGLNESLGLREYDLPGLGKEDLDFPETFTISADCTDFEMGPIGIVVTTGISGLDGLSAAEDFDDMRADLYELKGAQSDLSAWDPNRRIRSLFSTPRLTSGAQVLVEDIFRFYDLDTAMFDILPDYITEENIELFDRISEDLDEVDIDKLLDSEALEDLLDTMTKRNIENLRRLLDDYDTIKALDSDELGELIDQSIDLLDALEQYEEQMQTVEVLARYAGDMMELCEQIKASGLLDMMTDENIGAAAGGIAGSMSEKEIRPVLESIRKLENALENAPDEMSAVDIGISPSFIGLFRKFAPKEEEKLLPLMEVPLGTDMALFTPTIGASESGVTCRDTLESALQSLEDAVRKAAEDASNEGAQQTMDKVAKLKAEMEELERSLMSGLNVSTPDALSAKLEQAASFTKAMVGPLQQMMATAEKLADRLDHSPESGKLQYLLAETGDMLDDLKANEESIQALRRLLREYDADDMENFREHYNDLRHDLREVKPILQALRDDLEDPAVDRSLHSSPESVETLLKMKDDLLANREVSEILRETVSPDRVSIASGMFDTFDRLEEKGSVDKYVGQVDDADELLARKDAYVELAENYRAYTGAAEDAETSVKFIMKTDEIKIPEPEAAAESEQPQKQGFLDWCRGLLSKLKK